MTFEEKVQKLFNMQENFTKEFQSINASAIDYVSYRKQFTDLGTEEPDFFLSQKKCHTICKRLLLVSGWNHGRLGVPM